MIVLSEKLKAEVRKSAEERYFPRNGSATAEQRMAAANFECGALMYAEILAEATQAWIEEIREHADKQFAGLNDRVKALEGMLGRNACDDKA